MPSHDETSPVAPRAGSVRRPAAVRASGTGGGGSGRPPAGGSGRPPVSGRGRPSASRGGTNASRGGTSASRGGTSASRGGTTASRSGTPAGRGARPAGKPAAKGKAGPTPKQRRRRRLKIGAGILGGLFALLCVFVGVVYATTEVPSPDSVSTKQTTVLYYSDGVTEMARLGDENRTNVTLEQVSEPAQQAVLAAENRSFYTDPGISFTGIVRAAWNNVTGGSTQGGSTITQQYVKNAFLTQDQTFSRKFQELFLAIKLDNSFSKEQILENYLNTIYYGRGAYGIEAAANTYFGVPAAQLTPQQGAVLAVLVRSPSGYDPEINPEGAQDRWGLVLDAMAEEGWLTAEERAASVYPPVLPKTGSTLGIPETSEGLIVNQVLRELEGTYGYDEQQIRAGGLRVTTTVSKQAQDAAKASVEEVMTGEPDGLREALVAIDPRTGGVLAYYGGPKGAGEGAIDYAQAQRQPGSSVKPYVLATALEQGIGIDSRRDGSSPKKFEDREKPVVNSGGTSCPACTLTEAMTKSLNTTYYGLALEVGAQKVRETILQATGLPEVWEVGGLADSTTLANSDGGTGSAIGIGEYEMRPIDQAHGFATLAAGGVERDHHFVAQVTDSQGAVLVGTPPDTGGQVIPANVANDVTVAMKEVAGYSRRSLEGDREVAAKTGTQGQGENNSDAWMVGYTPSISTAVWMGNDSPQEPIVDVRGRIIYGSGLPGAIWKRFMDTVLAGTPEEDLPDKALIKGDTGRGVRLPEPAPTPTPTPEPTSSAPRPTFPDANNNGKDDRTEFPDVNNNGKDDRTEFPDANNNGKDDRTEFPDVDGNGQDDRTQQPPPPGDGRGGGTPGPTTPPAPR